LEDQTLEAMWGHYKSALDFAAGSWKTFVFQETMDIPGYSCYYRSAQASYLKGRCRGIQTPGRAKEKITAA